MPAKKVAKLGARDVARLVKGLKGWSLDDGGMLYRKFEFADFPRAFGFMASVATVAQAMDHHPEWSNVYNRVEIRLATHDAGGLTAKDFELARRIDGLV